MIQSAITTGLRPPEPPESMGDRAQRANGPTAPICGMPSATMNVVESRDPSPRETTIPGHRPILLTRWSSRSNRHADTSRHHPGEFEFCDDWPMVTHKPGPGCGFDHRSVQHAEMTAEKHMVDGTRARPATESMERAHGTCIECRGESVLQ